MGNSSQARGYERSVGPHLGRLRDGWDALRRTVGVLVQSGNDELCGLAQAGLRIRRGM